MSRDPNIGRDGTNNGREGTPSEQCLVARKPGKIQPFYRILILSMFYDNKVLLKYQTQVPCGMHWTKDIAVTDICVPRICDICWLIANKTRMWADAQRDGRSAEYRWRPLFNAAKFGWRPLLECRAVTLPRRKTRWNLQGCPNSRTDLSH